MTGIKDIAEDFLTLFYPELCLACGNDLVRGEGIMCTGCLVDMARTEYHIRRDNTLEKVFWGRCILERAASFSLYNRGSRIRQLVHLLKYKGRKDIGYSLGVLYGSYLAESSFPEGIDMLIPVPLHPERYKRRGYNQSEYIALGISEPTGIPVRNDLLYREGSASSQTTLGRYERWKNAEGQYSVRKAESISGRHLLLVDDVITTGSTIEACANALHNAAEVKVSAVALAAAQKITL